MFPIRIFAGEYEDVLRIIQSQGYPESIYIPCKRNLNFNLNTYKNYNNKVVYGSPTDVDNNTKDSKGEYRYLGYNFLKSKVTNPKFTNEVGYIPQRDWHVTTGYYVTNPERTWKIDNSSIKNYNLSAPLTGNGLNNELSANYFGGVNKVQLLNYATTFTGGSIKVEHTEHGSIRYGTFNATHPKLSL